MAELSFNDAHQKFVDFLKSKKRASATLLAYGKDIDQLLNYLKEAKVSSINAIKTEDIQGFLDKLGKEGYTPKSVSRKINSIKTFFRYLSGTGMVNTNPAEKIAHPKYETKPPRILTKIEYRALRDAARDDIRISGIIELLLQTGIRIGELANLQVEDFKTNNLVIRPNEGHQEREIPLNKSASAGVEKYLKIRPKTKEKTLFVTKTGHPLLIRNIRTAIDRYFRLADIKGTKVNDLRHTWIAHQLSSGASPVLVSKLAGHKRLSTTEKYLEYIKDRVEENVKLEEL